MEEDGMRTTPTKRRRAKTNFILSLGEGGGVTRTGRNFGKRGGGVEQRRVGDELIFFQPSRSKNC